jgi:sortase (surface protein transpeptidase)
MRIGKPAATLVLAAGLVAACAGAGGLVLTRHSVAAMPRTPVPALPAPTGPIVAPPQPSQSAPVAAPVSLTIPEIAVSTKLIRLGLTAAGALQVPSTTSVAGCPGIFFRLVDLHKGDRIYVRRADGTLAVFTVTDVHMYSKDAFPTKEVYGPTPDAELRLITCGGVFDHARGSYLSNVVVYAVEVA